MRKLNVISVFLIAVLLLVFAGYAFADERMGMGKAKHMGMGEHMTMIKQVLMMADYLGLSRKQMDDLNNLNIDLQINLINDNAAIEVAELKLMKLMSDYNLDKRAINKAVDKLYDLKKKKKKNMIDAHFKVMSILTKEQFKKLKELRMKMGRMSGAIKQQKSIEMEMMQHKNKMMEQDEENED